MKGKNQIYNKEIEEPIVSEKIELFIQQSENVTIPAIVFEYLLKDNSDFDANDLRNFYEQFGIIEDFELNGKISVVLFKLFFAANTCREFLQNEHNFKDNMKKDFNVRWFNLNEDSELIPEEVRNKYEQISKKNAINLSNTLTLSLNNMNNNIMRNGNIIIKNMNIPNGNYNIQNQYIQQNMVNNINNMNINNMNINNMNNMMNNMNNMNINNMNINNMNNMMNYNNSMNIQNLYMNGMIQNPINNSYEQNININNNNLYMNNINQSNIEEKNNGKFTCKYEILIPNDKEFQIARRLIGSKGCNMKKILDECKILEPNSNDVVKLRLRGKGSGYKEGPQNKESDEPLHLCISAKNQEGMIKASECVNELLNKIYEDYKKHCAKIGINPISKIANRVEGGNTVHKVNNNLFH